MGKKTYLVYVHGKKMGNWRNRLEINISINVSLRKSYYKKIYKKVNYLIQYANMES